MKKLMTMLGIITLTVTPVVTLVSCGTTDDHLDPDGNSIILEYGETLTNDKGEKVVGLDSKAILEAIKNKPSFKNKILEDVLSIVNSSFLDKLNLFFNTEEDAEKDSNKTVGTPINDKFKFYDDSTYSTLTNVWKNVQESVDRQISDEKEITNDDDAWKDKLVAKFPNFEDASIEFLENKYRTSLIVDGENNVETRIQQALINNNHSGVTFINKQSLNIIWNKHRQEGADTGTESYKAKIVNNDLMRKEFTQLYNAGQSSVETMISTKNINDEKDVTDKLGYIQSLWTGNGSGINAVPDEIDKLSVRESGVNGILSNSQNYFFNNYFEVKAPVVLSEVTFAYATTAKFEEGINKDSINNYGGSSAATKINTFFNDAKEAASDRNWISLVTNSDFSTKYGGTLTKADKIMTIDDEQNSYLKSTVYDYLLNPDSVENFKELKVVDDINADGVEWLEEINRTLATAEKDESAGKSGNLYGKVNDNLLVYLDESGVHFVHLQGNIKKQDEKIGDYDRLDTFGDKNNISENLYEQQKDLNNFNELSDQDKLAAVYEYNRNKKPEDKNTLGTINNSITNDYANYLINNSLTANISNSFSTYDVVNSMKEWAKSSSTSSVDAKLTLFDYFKELMNAPNDDEFLSKFIEFEGKDSAALKEMVLKLIGTLRKGSAVTSAMAMEKQFNELNKKIDAIKDDSITGSTTPPKATFKNDIFSADELIGFIMDEFKLFGPESDKTYSDLMSIYAIKGGN